MISEVVEPRGGGKHKKEGSSPNNESGKGIIKSKKRKQGLGALVKGSNKNMKKEKKDKSVQLHYCINISRKILIFILYLQSRKRERNLLTKTVSGKGGKKRGKRRERDERTVGKTFEDRGVIARPEKKKEFLSRTRASATARGKGKKKGGENPIA